MMVERRDEQRLSSACPPGRLSGKTIFLTGAGSGIGRESALLFLREGGCVAGFDTNAATLASLAEEAGTAAAERLLTLTGDVAEEDVIAGGIDEAVRAFGRLDVLCPFAGILWRDRDCAVCETATDDWERVIDVNLKGVYLTCKHGIPHVQRAGGGSVILMGSLCALVGTMPPQDAYNASKGALVALTRSLAVRYAADGVRCNIIHPGIIATAMQGEKLDDPHWVERVESTIPLGHLGTALDIATAALFLASDDATYVTGIELTVDGGFTAR